MPPEESNHAETVLRGDLENFLEAFGHEIRNRLNGIALEAADMAEQAPTIDASRLQQQVRDCAAFLKKVRETLAGAAGGEEIALPEITAKLRERRF